MSAEDHASDTRQGRPGSLATLEDKLFFILYYLKTYPLQEVLDYSFNLLDGVANRCDTSALPYLADATL